MQTLFTQVGKNIALDLGWYKNRHIIQIGFIVAIGLVGVTTLTLLIRRYRNTFFSIKVALSGCIVLFSFILIRASSFHHMDIFINMKLTGLKMNAVLELGGLAIISLGAIQYIRCKKT